MVEVETKPHSIVTDEKFLRQVSEPVTSDAEAKEIISFLEESLSSHIQPGIGLSAPQIGILKQVAIIRIGYGDRATNINIINPTEIELFENKFIYLNEGCLSFPGIRFNTKRNVGVEFVNNFGREAHLYHLEETQDNDKLLVVAVQHEIDHLFGKLFFDYKIEGNKVGPNERCICGSGKKYKKCCG